MRRGNNKIIETQKGHIFCYVGNKKGQRGKGFWIEKNWEKRLIEYERISDRIAVVKIIIGKKGNQILTVIQVYEPTAMSEDREIN